MGRDTTAVFIGVAGVTERCVNEPGQCRECRLSPPGHPWLHWVESYDTPLEIRVLCGTRDF